MSVTLVSLTDTIATATSFAARRGDEVEPNQEMIGMGAANIAAGLFQGFAVSTSGSRTAVAEQSGAKSQVTGLVGAALVAGAVGQSGVRGRWLHLAPDCLWRTYIGYTLRHTVTAASPRRQRSPARRPRSPGRGHSRHQWPHRLQDYPPQRQSPHQQPRPLLSQRRRS